VPRNRPHDLSARPVVAPRRRALPALPCALLTLTAACLSGCATSAPVQPAASPAAPSTGRIYVSAETPLQRSPGAVALVCRSEPSDLGLESIRTSGGPGGGSLHDTLSDLSRGAGNDATGLTPALILLVGGGLWLGGKASDAVDSANREKLQAKVAQLKTVAAHFDLAAHFSNLLVGRSGEISAQRLTPLSEYVRIEAPVMEMRLRVGSDGRIERFTPEPPPHPLAARDFDAIAVLEVRHSLRGPERPNSPLEYWVAVNVSLLRTRDWVKIGELKLEYASPPHPFAEWATDDARLLREQGESAVRRLDEEILDWLASGKKT
jgi:hypothetical protein